MLIYNSVRGAQHTHFLNTVLCSSTIHRNKSLKHYVKHVPVVKSSTDIWIGDKRDER